MQALGEIRTHEIDLSMGPDHLRSKPPGTPADMHNVFDRAFS